MNVSRIPKQQQLIEIKQIHLKVVIGLFIVQVHFMLSGVVEILLAAFSLARHRFNKIDQRFNEGNGKKMGPYVQNKWFLNYLKRHWRLGEYQSRSSWH